MRAELVWAWGVGLSMTLVGSVLAAGALLYGGFPVGLAVEDGQYLVRLAGKAGRQVPISVVDYRALQSFGVVVDFLNAALWIGLATHWWVLRRLPRIMRWRGF